MAVRPNTSEYLHRTLVAASLSCVLAACTKSDPQHNSREELPRDTVTYTIPARITNLSDFLATSYVERFELYYFLNRYSGPLRVQSDSIDFPVDAEGSWDAVDEFPRGRYVYKGDDRPFNGELVLNYATGTPAMSLIITDGRLHGPATVWFDDGAVFQVDNFERGLRHGWSIEYHHNGRKRWEAMYEDGKMKGMTTQWHFDGTVAHQQGGDKVEKRALSWWRNGMLKQFELDTVQNGKLDGWFRRWGRDGVLEYECLYKEGESILTNRYRPLSEEWGEF